jgi:hypothetical protein
MAKRAKFKSGARLVLDGTVYFEVTEGDRVVSCDEIDGELVLGCLVAVLERELAPGGRIPKMVSAKK